jgi:hypothetical protein
MMTVKRRPSQSAMSPAIRAPKKVPAERIEVMRDLCEEVRVVASGPSIISMKTFMPITPEMYPES